MPQLVYPEYNAAPSPDFFQKKVSVQLPAVPGAKSMVDGQKSQKTAGVDDTDAEEFRRLREAGLINDEEMDRRYKDYFDKMARERMARQSAQSVASEELIEPAEEAIGTGSISGNVVLPQELKKYVGDLVIYAMRESGAGRFVLPERLAYLRVQANEIMSFTVPYQIEELNDGRYKIFAQWDIAAPSIREESVAGHTVLGGLGAKGDYAGQFEDVVTLAAGEHKERVDFSCTQYLENNQFFFQSVARPDFQVSDIYYRRDSLGGRSFFLIIKNRSQKAIAVLPLDIQINDETFLPVPFEVFDIKPGQEKEVDITNVLADYQRMKQGAGEFSGDGPRAMKLKILWPATQEIEFEKTLYVI
jgi:hypothetical protein